MSPAEAVIRRALGKPVSVRFKETPLNQVIATLREKSGVPILLDLRALEEASASPPEAQKQPAKQQPVKHSEPRLSPKTPVTAELRDVSLESGLFAVLQPLGLTYTFDHECLLVTTPEGADQRLTTRCYNVADILGLSDDCNEGIEGEYDELIEAIISPIEPTMWDNVGGNGSISPFDAQGIHALVVSQSWGIHRKIEHLLGELRRLQARVPASERIRRPPSRTPTSDPKGKPGGGFF